MGALFSTLFAKIAAVVSWVSALFVAIFVAAWDILRDLFSWLFDQVLSVAVSAISAIDVSGITTNLSAFGSIPANVMLVMSCIGLAQAFSIIGTALAIRFALQLVPFTRLGS